MRHTYEPERPAEPPEAPVWGQCDDCGRDICVGDEYFYTPENLFHDVLCEDCAWAWLRGHRRIAEEELRS